MRGKKSDSAFVAQFISESVQEGIETPDQIVQRAKKQIAQIDEEIRAIEAKKIVRSKLLDVILSFEKMAKDKTEEAKLLPFFDIQYPAKCKEICIIMKDAKSLPIDWATHGTGDATTVFCFKQMIERKIIDRKGNVLVPGERFAEYWKFVLRED
jgi:hypothetical protein